MKKLLVAIASLLASCATYDDRALPAAQPDQVTAAVSYTLHGDTECLPPVRAAVERRAGEWAFVSRQHIAFRFVWDLTPDTLWLHRADPLLLCRPRVVDEAGNDLCGSTTGTIVDLSTAPRCDTSGSALHELGHLAGIPDVADPLAVMNANGRATRITASDVRACAAVGLCPRPRWQDVTTVTLTIDR